MDKLFGNKDAATVLSWETIRDVDKYLKADNERDTMKDKKPLNLLSSQGNISENNLKTAPKFAVDAYGRWREIRIPSHKDSINEEFFNQSRQKVKSGRDIHQRGQREVTENCDSALSFRTVHSGVECKSTQNITNKSMVPNLSDSSGKSTASTTARGYNHLSMSLKSNVFPGVGKEKWESSTKKTYVPKHLATPDRGSEMEFGIKKDSFMEWSEYDVYRQRLMKAWDKYITDSPKKEYSAPVKVVKKEKPKESAPVKSVKRKTNNTKKEIKQIVNKSDEKADDPNKPQEPQPTRIEVKPAPSDDGFWDFYEKPFAQS